MAKKLINSKSIYPAVFGFIILCSSMGFLGACEGCNKGKESKSNLEVPITDEMIAAAKKYTEYDRTPFLEEVLQKLKKKEKVDINATDPYGINGNKPDGATALHRAIPVDHVGIVKALLARKADVNQPDNLGNTPLHEAAVKGNTEIFRLLLAQPGVDVNKPGDYKQTPLHLAAEWGHTEIVQLLLNYPGIQVNVKDGGATTPLKLAGRMKPENESAIKKLLKEKGANE